MRGGTASVFRSLGSSYATAELVSSEEISSWLCDTPPPGVAAGLLQRQDSSDTRGGGSSGDGGCSSSVFTSADDGEGGEERRQSEVAAPARLLAEIKGMRVRESVLREVIERNGGGRRGFEALVGGIIVWLRAKCVSASQCSDADRLRPHSLAEGGGSHCGFVDPEPGAGTCASMLAVHSASGNVDENIFDWGEFGDESCLSIEGLTSGDPSHGWEPGSPPMVDSTVSGLSFLPKESAEEENDVPVWSGVRKRSPSPVRGSVHVGGVSSSDEVILPLSKVRRHTPPPSRGGGCLSAFGEVLVHGSIAAGTSAVPVSAIWGTPASSETMGASPYAPGGPFDLNFACPLPMDPISLEFASSFDVQGPILIDEYLSIPPVRWSALADGVGDVTGRSEVGIENSTHCDRNKSSSSCRSESPVESKGDPAVSMRAARKMRMHRNRKAAAASSKSKRESRQIVAADTGDGASDPNALRAPRRSRRGSASDGRPTKLKWKGHRDQRHLQFVLQKMLTASDVGNLGRMVLPKKDAEEKLPLLDTGDKLQLECEDYDTARMMTLGFRFWLNNGSRMYLMERTGGFVSDHHLREADRMILYKNHRRGNYLIQAVKARDYTDHFLRTIQSQEPPCNGSEFSEKDSGSGASEDGKDSGLVVSEDGKGSVETGAFMLKSSATCGHELLVAIAPVASDVFSKKDDSQLNAVNARMEDEWENSVSFSNLEFSESELLAWIPGTADKQSGASTANDL